MPHDDLVQFALDKRLLEVDYVALNAQLSADREHPTVFDVVGEVRVSEGETIFDLLQWKTENAGVAMDMMYQGQATGYISDFVFGGVFSARYWCTFPSIPLLQLGMETSGTFSVELDNR